jgi:hypothetical protein
MAWKGQLLTGFERREGRAIDLFVENGCSWIAAVKACYPELGLSELARLIAALEASDATIARQLSTGLCAEYGLRWCERLQATMKVLTGTSEDFQEFVDTKKLSARDLAPLLALADAPAFAPFLSALAKLPLSKSEVVRALELGVELLLLDHPLTDLLPTDPEKYLQRLEKWRRPGSLGRDENWAETVQRWPWPSQVQGQWQRFGDQSGLEIRIRTTSPGDFAQKLQRLNDIRDNWSCNG